MTAASRYTSPSAFRRALTDRLAARARESRWTLQQLQRQVAYDRLLDRLYLVDDGWVVKGAVALLAREISVRATLDIDVYRDASTHVALADLRRAAALDLGDWFVFELGGSTSVNGKAIRMPVRALIGTTTWVDFSVDLVGSDLHMTGQPEDVPPLARGTIPDVEQRPYKAYPLADHVADKVAATYERHSEQSIPSTRFRDLVDLVAIALVVTMDADPLIDALRSEFARRELQMPESFDVPDRRLWGSGYSREARASLLGTATTVDDALAIVRPFLDPALSGTAGGTWDPGRLTWRT